MKNLNIKITDDLLAALKRGAKKRKMSIGRFITMRLQTDLYDLVTEDLISDNHIWKTKNEETNANQNLS